MKVVDGWRDEVGMVGEEKGICKGGYDKGGSLRDQIISLTSKLNII